MLELKSAADVYETIGAMMGFVAGTPAFGPALRQIDEIWTFSLTDPEAQITCSFVADGPIQIEFGPSHRAADVTISMSAMNANSYLLGELNPFVSLDQGRIAIEGSPTAFLRAIPRIRDVVAPDYQAFLETGNDPFSAPEPNNRERGAYEYLKGDPADAGLGGN